MMMYGHKDKLKPTDAESDTDWDDDMMTQAREAISKRVAVSRKFDVIYLAGTSSDGRIVYIDRDLPESYTDSRGEECYVEEFLVFHEMVEQSLMSHMGLRYQLAHQISLRAERDLVESEGWDWEEYDAFMGKWAEKALKKKDPESPPDLDTKPYVDENDDVALKRMDKEYMIPRDEKTSPASSPVPYKPEPMEVVVVKKKKKSFGTR
jgi:hypothetical protein